MRKAFFDKQTTNIIKGVLVILMFAHHFFTFPEWWLVRDCNIDPNIAKCLRLPLKICVPVYCFLNGYLNWYHPVSNIHVAINRIQKVMIGYWTCFMFCAVLYIVNGGGVHYFFLPS